METEKNIRRDRLREALGKIYDDTPPLLTEYLRRYRQDPKSRVFVPLAEAYRRLGRLDQAIEVCRKGLEFHPDFQAGRVALARCYMDKKEYSEARAALETVIKSTPENLLAQRLLGETCAALGDRESALHSYRMASRLSPEDVALAERVRELEKTNWVVPVDVSSLPQPVPHTSVEPEPGPSKATEEMNRWLSEMALGEDSSVDSNQGEETVRLNKILGVGDAEEEAYKVEPLRSIFEDKLVRTTEITTETLGDLYLAQGQFDQALKIFERVHLDRSSTELDSKLDTCRLKLGVGPEDLLRRRKVQALQRVLQNLKVMKSHQKPAC